MESLMVLFQSPRFLELRLLSNNPRRYEATAMDTAMKRAWKAHGNTPEEALSKAMEMGQC